MSALTSIEWTDATWNPVRGCSRVSEGCRNCYAERVAARFSREGLPFHGFAKDRYLDHDSGGGSKPRWTGRVELVESHLELPLRWRKPRRIFVNSMSDLFHESLPDEAIAAVFGVMAASSRHTFQILTKRPERMREWFDRISDESTGGALTPGRKLNLRTHEVMGGRAPGGARIENAGWPLPNVWLGVSVEDQATADARIQLLLQTPAAHRFVSYEPAIGPINLAMLKTEPGHVCALSGYLVTGHGDKPLPRLDWLIVGGESGPGARPFDVAWARSVVEQCKAARVPCFVKQLGARPVWNGSGLVANNPPVPTFKVLIDGGSREVLQLKLRSRKGSDPSEWPADLRVREVPA